MRWAVAVVLVGVGVASLASAEEGMWTFDNPPRAAIKKRYDVGLDEAWLDRLRRATVRLEGGCTGSFASAAGLVLTNHHCVRECVQQLSTAAQDFSAKGFLARTRAQERQCASEQVSVLTRLEDITRDVAAAIADTAGAEANERRKAELTRLEQQCEEAYRGRNDPHSCEAVTLYGGGQYFLYHYKRYSDVRLVFAPEDDVAFFGGDLDNFQFPRWNLDMGLLRVYEDGKPAVTPDFLRWRRGGAQQGEAVFVAGHPGSTERLRTVAQLLFEREVVLPRWLPRATELRGRYQQFAAAGPEPARTVQSNLFNLENYLKVRRNEFDVLLEQAFITAKSRDEDKLRRSAAASAKWRATARAWGDIEAALATYRSFYDEHVFVEAGAGFQGDLMQYARTLVRAAAERARPNDQRLREFTDAALPGMRQRLLAPQPVYPELEILRLTFSLEKLREYLGPDHPVVRALLASESPRALATRLVRATRLADPAYRTELWEGGSAAIDASTDAMIALAERIEPEARRTRKRYDDEVEAVIAAAEERIARARFALNGTATYPDATFTLRLSYGSVQGWREPGRDIEPFTTLETLYLRATGQPPFVVPPSWLQAQDRINLGTRFNFATTNDIVGGNSGSPMVDAQGRLVGLIFDGNIHSIGGSYWFDAALNRAVAVHPAAMLLALGEVYGATELTAELAIE
jgi:hypothetical protein